MMPVGAFWETTRTGKVRERMGTQSLSDHKGVSKTGQPAVASMVLLKRLSFCRLTELGGIQSSPRCLAAHSTAPQREAVARVTTHRR